MRQRMCDKCKKAISADNEKVLNKWGKAYIGTGEPRDYCEEKDLCEVCYKKWKEYARKFFDADVS